MRASPVTIACISLVVLASYLSAVAFDCERPRAEPRRPGLVASASTGHGTMAGHAASPSHPAGAHEHGQAHASPGHAVHGAHHAAERHGADPHAPERASTRTPRSSLAVMVPTCSCGCSRTRALVGGSASRLGSVVPRIELASLPEAPRIDHATPYRARTLEVVRTRDRVPI